MITDRLFTQASRSARDPEVEAEVEGGWGICQLSVLIQTRHDKIVGRVLQIPKLAYVCIVNCICRVRDMSTVTIIAHG